MMVLPNGPNGIDPIALAVLFAVTLQRLAELVYSHRNETWLRAHGAIEHGAAHYPAMVALHATWLIGLWIVAIGISPSGRWLAIFAVLQALRIWVLVTLGHRWTTRILVLPGAPLVGTGPYRVVSHPNYAVVAAEIFVLPMAFGLLTYALVFSVLNAIILWIRIGAESQALRPGVATQR
jgi:methyltransferase